MKTKLVFLGSDGSGKSTLIEFVKKELRKEGIKAESFVFGWKDFHNPLLKAISNFYLKRRKEEKERIDRFRNRSFLFYLIYYAELWQRYLKVLFSDAEIILFDRYFYDELAFASSWKQKLFSFITPKPDLCVVIKTNIKTMRKRSYKTPKEKYDYFYEHLLSLKKPCKTIVLDGSNNLNELYWEIKESLKSRKI